VGISSAQMKEEVEVVPTTIEDAVPPAPFVKKFTRRGKKKRKTAAEEPLSGLDAWAAEAEVAVPPPVSSITAAAPNGADEGGGNGGNVVGAASTSQPQQPPQQPQHTQLGNAQLGNTKRRKCFRYGNYHRYYGYRVGESLEDHRIPHFKKEWFEGGGGCTS
jgi:7SK snRNA methylphosphate capping enzyme